MCVCVCVCQRCGGRDGAVWGLSLYPETNKSVGYPNTNQMCGTGQAEVEPAEEAQRSLVCASLISRQTRLGVW